MLLSAYTNIINWLQQHQLPCLFKSLFHIDCPGCGFQRSAILLLKGNFLESVKMYPALIPVLLLFIYSGYYLIKKNSNGLAVIKFLFAASAIIIFIHYIYKSYQLL
jgi:Protein of unknown function (DUF2752)